MLDPSFGDRLDALLADDDAGRSLRYPGPPTGWRPMHTVYVPADRFAAHTVDEWRAGAIAALDEHGPLPVGDAALEELVRARLAMQPIEDLRVDFEDGYGNRSDAEEDNSARATGAVLGRYPSAPCFGIRMKSLEPATRRRGLRTLELVLAEMLAFGGLSQGFRVTLPKVTSIAQVQAMVEICAALESVYSLRLLRFEIQVEMPQAVLGADGTAPIAAMLHASAGRCVGLHYGTYDYSAALGISPAQQSSVHPVAQHAKDVMQVAAALTGVPVSDGSTNVLPVGSRADVQAAWALHAGLVRSALERGIYQGWDLHPAQLPTRFAATLAFYRDGMPAAAARLAAYRSRAASGVLDEPATERALIDFLRRSVRCGACTWNEVRAAGFDINDFLD